MRFTNFIVRGYRLTHLGDNGNKVCCSSPSLPEQDRGEKEMDRKWYCFDCRYLDLKVDKQGNITGEKYCPIWKLHRSDWQDICSSFESKKEVKQAKICRGKGG